jgi:hypothetical protein
VSAIRDEVISWWIVFWFSADEDVAGDRRSRKITLD